MLNEKIELMAMSWADEMLVHAMNTIKSTATAPPFPATACAAVENRINKLQLLAGKYR